MRDEGNGFKQQQRQNSEVLARVLLLQWVLILITGAVCLVFAGSSAALSALLGGASCAVPNAWFAWRLKLAARRPGGARVTDFFMGEVVKVVLTLALMFLAVKLYVALVWLAFIAGLVLTLKSYWFGLLFKKFL